MLKKYSISDLTLSRHHIHLWTTSVEQPGERVEGLYRYLSKDEADRADRFRFEQDRRNFIVSRGTLRTIMARYLSGPPNNVQFQYGLHGKPSLLKGFEHSGLQFNLTHSNGFVLYAVTIGWEIGVDIEYIRPIDDLTTIVSRYFSKNENKLINKLPESERLEAFYYLWTRKEAYLKAKGLGISHGLRFDISIEQSLPEIINLDVEPQPIAGWIIHSFRPLKEYQASFAVQGEENYLNIRYFFDL